MYIFFCRKAQSKTLYLQKAIEQSELKEQNVQDQLASVIKVVSSVHNLTFRFTSTLNCP